jgi:hypothetical protein
MKPVLVFYINVGNMDIIDVVSYIELVKNSTGHIKGYEQIFIPVRNRDSEVQCLNPYYLDKKEEIRKMKHTLKELGFNTNKLLDSMPYLSRKILMIEKKQFKF